MTRLTELETHQKYTSDRLRTLDPLRQELTELKERIARLEEWRNVQITITGSRTASATLNWTKIGVLAAIALGGIGIVLTLVLR